METHWKLSKSCRSPPPPPLTSLTPHPGLTHLLRHLIPFAPRLGRVFSLACLSDAPSSLRKFLGVFILVRIFLFLLFLSSFLLTISLFSAGTWDPLSLANARAGCPPFFSRARCALLPLTNARRFVFFLHFHFLFADHPALLFAPLPRVAPPLAAPRHASHFATRRPSSRVTRPLVVSPSRHASPLRHASRCASVTRPPCRVASRFATCWPSPHVVPCYTHHLSRLPFSRRLATSRRLVWICGGDGVGGRVG